MVFYIFFAFYRTIFNVVTGQREMSTLQVSSVVSNYETESLEIYENTNGQIMIRNLSYVNIKSMDDLYLMLREGVIYIII